jgi:hypothetical protein
MIGAIFNRAISLSPTSHWINATYIPWGLVATITTKKTKNYLILRGRIILCDGCAVERCGWETKGGVSEKLDGPITTRAMCKDICKKRGRSMKGPKKLMENGKDLLRQEQRRKVYY